MKWRYSRCWKRWHSKWKGNAVINRCALVRLLRYNPKTGLFTWRIDRGAVKAGAVAGCLTRQGYVQIRIDDISYSAHRLAWLYCYGVWPENELDHKDGRKANNRFTNLRPATTQQNKHNQRKAHSRSSTGLLGVVPRKDGKFLAKLKVKGKRRIVRGPFKTAIEAHLAYVEIKRSNHEFCTI